MKDCISDAKITKKENKFKKKAIRRILKKATKKGLITKDLRNAILVLQKHTDVSIDQELEHWNDPLVQISIYIDPIFFKSSKFL